MSQLSLHKHRFADAPNGIKPRTKVFFAIAVAFVAGKFTEYTYVQRMDTVVTIQTSPYSEDKLQETHRQQNLTAADEKITKNVANSEQASTTISLKERQNDDEVDSPTQQMQAKTDVVTVSKAKEKLRIEEGKASQESNTSNLFTIVSDPRSGAEYTMNLLDQHEYICSSGTYPKSALLPNTMPWIADDAIEKGCTLAFIRESILAITSKPDFESRCVVDYDASNDEFKNHIVRFCLFIKSLDGDFTREAITRLFLNAFAETSDSTFTGCQCPETSQVRILKVSADWIGEALPIETTLIKGSKMIRLTRRNLFERYMSFIVAQSSGQWSIQSEVDKMTQLNLFREKNYEIDIDDMLLQLQSLLEFDRKTENWVNENGSQILWIDHSEIRDDPLQSHENILEFLGMRSGNSGSLPQYLRQVEQTTKTAGSLSQYNGEGLLRFITNRDQVIEALWSNGYGSFIGLFDDYNPLQYIAFADTENFRVHNSRKGLTITIPNEAQHVYTTNEPSAKFHAVVPLLKKMSNDTLVVLSNGGVGGLNPHIRRSATFFDEVSQIRSLLKASIHSDSVLVSVSNECCSDAMMHTPPGSFFLPNGQRDARTCKAGECNGFKVDNDASNAWMTFMKEQSVKYEINRSDNIYLDGTFMGGTAKNLLNFIDAINILPWEDDRAVMTDYMYRFPDKVVLDYEQKVFAGRFDGYSSKMNLDCGTINAKTDVSKGHDIVRTTSPLFVHSSRWMQSCQRKDDIKVFPSWDAKGIQIKAIIDHVDRALNEDVSMGGIDRHFDKEILYIVDSKGVWASEVHRDRYRVQPTEEFLTLAHQALQKTDLSSQRWSNLQRTMQSAGFPYWAWYGDWKDCNYHNIGEVSIPLFTTCASTACNHSFPTPSYMTIIDSQPDTPGWYQSFRRFDEKYPWESKIRKVVWRGGLSENNPLKVFDSQRWRLCSFVASLTDTKQKDMFDIGLTNIPEFLTAQIDIDASIAGGIVKGISAMNDFQNYIAVLDMDGNSWSSRFGTLLCYNSLAMKVEPAYADYFFYDLVPWKHYVPIKNDLSDLLDNVAFVLDPSNESIIREIIAAANQWCAERFTKQGLVEDMLDIWESYVQLLDRADPNWTNEWEEKKKTMFSSSSTIPLVQLK